MYQAFYISDSSYIKCHILSASPDSSNVYGQEFHTTSDLRCINSTSPQICSDSLASCLGLLMSFTWDLVKSPPDTPYSTQKCGGVNALKSRPQPNEKWKSVDKCLSSLRGAVLRCTPHTPEGFHNIQHQPPTVLNTLNNASCIDFPSCISVQTILRREIRNFLQEGNMSPDTHSTRSLISGSGVWGRKEHIRTFEGTIVPFQVQTSTHQVKVVLHIE